MKKFYVLFALFVTVNSFSQSPITLSNTNMPGSNDTLRYSVAQISSVGNYTQTGANFNWNFSTLVPISQGLRSYKSALNTPYAFLFFGLNEYGEKIADTLGAGPVTITNYYNFYKKSSSNPNAYLVDGAGMTFSSIPVPSYYTDKDELYMFPMTYPKYDSTTFRFSTPTTTLLPFTYIKAGYRVTKVDGWGTVTTPYGTASCLRLVTTQYSKDTIKNQFFPIGFPNYTRSYQWLTTSSKIPFLEINGNLIGNNFTVNQVRYRDNYLNLAGINENSLDAEIAIYPNPVIDKLSIFLRADKNYSYEVIDINGKQIYPLTNIENNSGKFEVDVTKLPHGVYNFRLTENNKNIDFKFIKQ